CRADMPIGDAADQVAGGGGRPWLAGVPRTDGGDERGGPAERDVDADLVHRIIGQDRAEAIIGERLLNLLHRPSTVDPTDPAGSRSLGLRRDVDADRDHDLCMMADWHKSSVRWVRPAFVAHANR